MTATARIPIAFTIALVLAAALNSQTLATPTSNVPSRENPETSLTNLATRTSSVPHLHVTFQRTNDLLQEPWIRAATQRLRFAIRTTNAPANSTSTTATVEPQGYTFDPCRFHNDCLDGRLCARNDQLGACSGTLGCLCIKEEIQLCYDCEECLEYPMETCVLEKRNVGKKHGICASNYTVYEPNVANVTEAGCNSFPGHKTNSTEEPPSEENEDADADADADADVDVDVDVPVPVAPKPKPSTTTSPTGGAGNDRADTSSETAVCIDAELLQHLAPSQRVYEEHVTARVLCDMEGSCATPGHMLVYKGHVLMMHDYCARRSDGCISRSMLVNSPRYEKALRVPSRTHGLYFTALAARFETRVEGHALALAIRLGL